MAETSSGTTPQIRARQARSTPVLATLVHLFGKSHRKSDRAYLHSLQIDIQLGKI